MVGDSDPIIKNLQELLQAQSTLRGVAEQQAREARQVLVRVAEALCGAALDHIGREQPQGIRDWPAGQVGDLIVDEVGQRLDALDLSDGSSAEALTRYRQANEEIVRLRQALDQARRQAEERESVYRQAEAQIGVLEQTVADLQRRLDATTTTLPAAPAAPGLAPVEPRAPPAGPEPEWVRAWREQATFDNDRHLVEVLGATGECRRNRIAGAVAARLGVSASSGGIKRGFARLIKQGLLEVTEIRPLLSGGSPHLLRLTEPGRDAYRFLAHQEPRPSLLDALLPRHKSPEHVFLNLETADLLEEHGYSVDRFPPSLTPPQGGEFVPDIKAISPEGVLLWVEVERDTRKAVAERARKWEIYYAASGGHFVIVTPDRAAMHALQSEIVYWAGSRALRLWLSNLSDVAAGERGRDGGLWLQRRGE
jgi:hypothetical protein